MTESADGEAALRLAIASVAIQCMQQTFSAPAARRAIAGMLQTIGEYSDVRERMVREVICDVWRMQRANENKFWDSDL